MGQYKRRKSSLGHYVSVGDREQRGVEWGEKRPLLFSK